MQTLIRQRNEKTFTKHPWFIILFLREKKFLEKNSQEKNFLEKSFPEKSFLEKNFLEKNFLEKKKFS